jgi:thioredoxin-like negative regulator of GroEL
MSEVRDAVEHRGHGEYREIEEVDFLKQVTESDFVVVHFYHPEFRRCAIMDAHLAKIAPKYLTTKFIKMDVLKSSFFVLKLNIKILPAVIMFKKGVAFDRYV